MNTREQVLNSLLGSRWVYRATASSVRQALASHSLTAEHGGWLKQAWASLAAGLPSEIGEVVTGVSAQGELPDMLIRLIEGVRERARKEDLVDYGEFLENQAVSAAVAALASYDPENPLHGEVADYVQRSALEALRTAVNRAKSLQIVRDSLTGAGESVKEQAANALQGLVTEPGAGVTDSQVEVAIKAYLDGLESDDREILACYLGAGGSRPCMPDEIERLLQIPAADVRLRYQRIVQGLQAALTRLGLKFLSNDTRRSTAWVASVAANCKALSSYEPSLFRLTRDLTSTARRGSLAWATPFESADDVTMKTMSGEEFNFSKTGANRFSSAEQEVGFFDIFKPVNDVEIEAFYDTRRNISRYDWQYLGKEVWLCRSPGHEEEHVTSQDVYRYLADNFGFDDIKFGEQVAGGFVTHFTYDALENDVCDVVYNEWHRAEDDQTKVLPAEHGEFAHDLSAERHDPRSRQVRDNRVKAEEGAK